MIMGRILESPVSIQFTRIENGTIKKDDAPPEHRPFCS